MKYYSTWQEALVDFIAKYGQEYKEVDQIYALMDEFNYKLQVNKKGTYFMYFGENK